MQISSFLFEVKLKFFLANSFDVEAYFTLTGQLLSFGFGNAVLGSILNLTSLYSYFFQSYVLAAFFRGPFNLPFQHIISATNWNSLLLIG